MAIDYNRLTPVEAYEKRRRFWWCLVWLLIIIGLIWYFVVRSEYVIAYADPEEHFKYGSIGSEGVTGLPTPIIQALPVMYKDKLGDAGWAALGLHTEEGQPLPIGFSRRVVTGVERAWLNCSVCHMGTYKLPGDDELHFIPGGASNDLLLYDLIAFFIDVGRDPGFTADRLIAAINSDEVPAHLNFLERPFYRYVVFPQVKAGLRALADDLTFVLRQEPYGPGRVDTFNTYKVLQFNFAMGPDDISDVALNGSTDYPSIWMQGPRAGMNLHWDGNNNSVAERNLSAALGAGVSPVSVDHTSLAKVRAWIDTLPAPDFPGEINAALAEKGKPLFQKYCSACHGMGGVDGYDYSRIRYPYLGEVVDLAEIGTDRGRWESYDQDFAAAQMTLYSGYPWQFKHFKKTAGYANHPLDGIWARSPYLHNGSVPTLRDLMDPASERPKVWFRGSQELDLARVGYRSDEAGGGRFKYDTSVLGNHNYGHEGRKYGTDLPAAAKDAIVEYMKTL